MLVVCVLNHVLCSSKYLCFVCDPIVFYMCSLQISVLFVFMRVEISLFHSCIVGSCGVFLLVMFLCAILLRMWYGRSLSVLHILPTGMCCLPAWYNMLANVLFASCMSVGGCIAVEAYSVSCMNLSQSAFL